MTNEAEMFVESDGAGVRQLHAKLNHFDPPGELALGACDRLAAEAPPTEIRKQDDSVDVEFALTQFEPQEACHRAIGDDGADLANGPEQPSELLQGKPKKPES